MKKKERQGHVELTSVTCLYAFGFGELLHHHHYYQS